MTSNLTPADTALIGSHHALLSLRRQPTNHSRLTGVPTGLITEQTLPRLVSLLDDAGFDTATPNVEDGSIFFYGVGDAPGVVEVPFDTVMGATTGHLLQIRKVLVHLAKELAAKGVLPVMAGEFHASYPEKGIDPR